MIEYAPSRFWFATKDGTPVKKFDTAGKTVIDLPESLTAVPCDTRSELKSEETNPSVLTDSEADKLRISRV